LGGVMLRSLVSSGPPFREIVISIFASPAHTQVTSTGQRESSVTLLNVMRASDPFTAAVSPGANVNDAPGSTTAAV
jgi:hypothetical protein